MSNKDNVMLAGLVEITTARLEEVLQQYEERRTAWIKEDHEWYIKSKVRPASYRRSHLVPWLFVRLRAEITEVDAEHKYTHGSYPMDDHRWLWETPRGIQVLRLHEKASNEGHLALNAAKTAKKTKLHISTTILGELEGAFKA